MSLGQRAVACKGWTSTPPLIGMCAASQRMPDGVLWTAPTRTSSGAWLPDLTDPATLGCLLALVRAAWDAPGAYVHHDSGAKLEPGHPWEVWCGDGSNIVGVFDTEAEALVAALESAP